MSSLCGYPVSPKPFIEEAISPMYMFLEGQILILKILMYRI
jgi:hypothetical protein